jgi:hypothetical protein
VGRIIERALRLRCKEPEKPYDGKDEEKTPLGTAKKIERCRPCRGTGFLHVRRDRRDLDRGRACPFCRGFGFRIVDAD